MARQHGYKGDVMIDPTGASTFATVASLNQWTADFSRERVDTTCFNDPVKTSLPGLPDAKGTFTGIWDPTTTPTQVFDVAFGDVAVALKLVPSTLTATTFFSGLAFLDASITVAVNGVISISGNWSAAGAFTLTSP